MTTPRPGRVRVWCRNNRWRWCCACGATNSSGSGLIRRMYRQAAIHARTCPAIRAHATEAIIRDAHRIACSTGADIAVLETLERAWGVASCE